MRLIICFFLGTIPFSWANTPEETPLLPEVEKLLTLKPIDENTMDQNAFVALMGMDAPLDKDPIEIGKKIILNNFKKLKASYEEKDITMGDNLHGLKTYYPNAKPFNINMEVEGAKYQFPCPAYAPINCLDQILADRAPIELLMVRNNILLQRHAKIVKMSSFDYYYSSAMSPMPAYVNFMNMLDLRLSKAVFAINDNNVQQGLTILQENIDFVKRMLSGEGTVIDTMVALNQLTKNYHIISELLDQDILNTELDNPQLIALLQPLSTEVQQSLMVSIKNEFTMRLASMYYYADPNEPIRANFGKKNNNKTVDINASINFIYEDNALLFEILKRVLPESGKYYREYLVNNQAKNQARLLTNKITNKYARKNIMNSTTAMNNFEEIVKWQDRYLYRLYDVSNYLALINAKLKIKQADIKVEDIPKFLVKMGNEAKNPYSLKPFVWDAKMQILSSDWLSTIGKTEDRDGVRATVEIKFKTD